MLIYGKLCYTNYNDVGNWFKSTWDDIEKAQGDYVFKLNDYLF